MASTARFAPGERIQHLRFGYRGVIADVDPVFSLTEEWYEEVARSRPPKDEPWYHVLVHDSGQMTYVAERHLESDPGNERVRHPLLEEFFEDFRDGRYVTRARLN